MNTYKKPVVITILSLAVILIGLFLLCAQQRGKVGGGEDLSADDEAFRQELLQMLDLTEVDQDTEQVDEITLPDESEDDVLSLLVPEKAAEKTSEKSAPEASPVSEAARRTTPETMGMSEEMFIKIQNDVDRLEKTLEERTAAVDSLRRIIENRNARIRELEQRLQAYRAGKTSGTAVASTASTRRSSATTSAASSDFMRQYRVARSLFERYEYNDAIEAFQNLLQTYPNHPMADNCQYWIGESYFGLKQYQKAILEFQKVFAYPQTDKYDDAQLMIGLSYVRIGQRDRARSEFQTFLNNYAGSEYESVAKKYIRTI